MLVRRTAVTYLLSFRPQQFDIPTVVTMTIAATRMHRSLVVFATPDDVCVYSLHILCPAHHDQRRFSTHKNFQISGLKFAKTKQTRATPIPLNPMVTSACNVLQQNQTREMTDNGVSTNMGEDVYDSEEPNGSTLEEGIERSE